MTDEEWARFDALDAKIAKIRPYHLIPATLFKLSQRQVEIVLRPDADGDIDVSARVAELRRAIKTLQEWRFTKLLVIPDSEPNLRDDANPAGKPYRHGYWTQVAQVVAGIRDLLSPTVLIVSPPLAVGQRESEWYANAVMADGSPFLDAFDLIAGHGYGQNDTGLLEQSIAMAKQFGRPLLFDEVGDSSETLGDGERIAAIGAYLDIIEAAGAYAGLLFLLGSDDARWRIHILPVDRVAALRRSPATEVPMALKANFDQLPVFVPGQQATVTLSVVDEATGAIVPVTALGQLYLELPRRGDYGYAPDPVAIDADAEGADVDGRFQFTLTVPSFDLPAPAAGALRFNLLVIPDYGKTFESSVPVLFSPAAQAQTAPQPQPDPAPVPETVPTASAPNPSSADVDHTRMVVFDAAGAGFNLDGHPLWLDIQRAVAAMKEGKPFPSPRR